jgi:hypothetical protein
MTAVDVLAELRTRGCRVWLDKSGVRVRGPAVPPNLRSAATAHRDALRTLLEAEAAARQVLAEFERAGAVCWPVHLSSGQLYVRVAATAPIVEALRARLHELAPVVVELLRSVTGAELLPASHLARAMWRSVDVPAGTAHA